MGYRRKLFTHKSLYDHQSTNECFKNTIKANVYFHIRHCKEYRKILRTRKYRLKDIREISDLYKVPPIPTLYFKHNSIKSMPYNKMIIKATSSGTKGKKSRIGYDFKGLYYGAHMVYRMAKYHKLLSAKPTNYIIFGYQPSKTNQTVISKTALGATMFAPAIKRTYALKYKNGAYQLDMEGLKKSLLDFSKKPFPVRLIGFQLTLICF